jgi:hypothetical protein
LTLRVPSVTTGRALYKQRNTEKRRRGQRETERKQPRGRAKNREITGEKKTEQKIHRDEKERKIEEQRRDKDWPCHCLYPCIKKNDPEIIFHRKSASASSS